MKQRETTPQCLASCTGALLEALAEARALVLQGSNGAALREKLRFADELVKVIGEAVAVARYDRSASQAFSYLSGEVRSLSALVRPIALSI